MCRAESPCPQHSGASPSLLPPYCRSPFRSRQRHRRPRFRPLLPPRPHQPHHRLHPSPPTPSSVSFEFFESSSNDEVIAVFCFGVHPCVCVLLTFVLLALALAFLRHQLSLPSAFVCRRLDKSLFLIPTFDSQ